MAVSTRGRLMRPADSCADHEWLALALAHGAGEGGDARPRDVLGAAAVEVVGRQGPSAAAACAMWPSFFFSGASALVKREVGAESTLPSGLRPGAEIVGIGSDSPMVAPARS